MRKGHLLCQVGKKGDMTGPLSKGRRDTSAEGTRTGREHGRRGVNMGKGGIEGKLNKIIPGT